MTLRGAILGAGNIAQLGHLPAYADAGEGGRRCQIVAAADLCEENLRRIAVLVPGIRTFARVDELLRSVHPDFVDICAPPFAHRDLIEQAVDAGCHILCEKPLSLTEQDADALVARLRDEPLVFVPGHQYHHAPVWQELRSIIAGSEIGTLRFGSISIERQGANAGNRHWNPAWRTCEAFSGGGILMDHGTHLFYQLRTILGDPIRIGARIEARRHPAYEVEDTACCYLDFGSMAVRIRLTWAGGRRRTVHHYLGSQGKIICNESEIEVSSPTGARRVPVRRGFSSDSTHADWYTPLLQEFMTRIESRNFDREPLQEAVATVRWTAAAYASALSGRPVDLPRPATIGPCLD